MVPEWDSYTTVISSYKSSFHFADVQDIYIKAKGDSMSRKDIPKHRQLASPYLDQIAF